MVYRTLHYVSIASMAMTITCGLTSGHTGARAVGRGQAGQSSETGNCLACHSLTAAALAKKTRHGAVESGCDTCHVDHRKPRSAGGQETGGLAHYLNEKQPALCLPCHDASENKIIDAHNGQPFDKSECTGCHDPHSSDSPKLVPERSHAPYAARECDSCHKPPKDGCVQLEAATVNELCFTCHDDLKKRLDGAKSRHTLLGMGDNSCVECHDPHATNHDHGLKRSQRSLCGSCHADLTQGKKYVHEPVQASCTYCHDAHGSNHPKNLQASTNELCLGCHGPVAIKIVQGPEPVTLFDGRVTLPPKPFEDLKYFQLDGDNRKGHPFPGHPVFVPAVGDKPGINCLTCHRTHAANGSPVLLVSEDANTNAVCIPCHK